ncbi:hypothetical protein BD309DRAFT_905380 [Dichomitus squalens]|uniref:F-box domain-containing protein n=1 Tax=Dichomitus squalens TaxID=114155 RepID=A0A4Q9MPJ1_9APHY|nr:hypothetical protein BD311DRAFT_807206 [Dichomitus squalens]TBU37330.1 hypothetical protein BD309DRAFT_905380 [Dichomitus squalens]TBU51194.1 hypothetical protein BD310DRAFT_982821 [Dichomitus squalens]
MQYDLPPRKKFKVGEARSKPESSTPFPRTPLDGPIIQTAPIARLPTELLTTIFSLVGPYQRLIPFSDEGAKTWMGWARLMLVCRHWRNVGLSTRWLWRRIGVTSNLEALQYRLSRTVGCTIDVIFSSYSETNERAVPLLLPYARSIRSVQMPEWSLGFYESDNLPAIKPLFEVPLPALERIDLSGLPLLRGRPLDTPFDLGLSEKLHPGVRRLVMPSHIKMPSTPTFWSALRELDISSERYDGRQACLDDFLQVVAGAPYLESLAVLGTLTSRSLRRKDTPTSGDDVPTSPYRLARLRTVRLEGELAFVAPILQRIDAPALCVLHISACIPPDADIADSAALLFPPPLRHVLAKCKALYVSKNEPSDFQICSNAHQNPRNIQFKADALRVPLFFHVISYRPLPPQLSTVIGVLCDGFCTAPLQTLVFEEFSDSAPVAAWRSLQATFSDLQSIRVGSESLELVYNFFFALRGLAPEGGWPLLSCLEVDFGHISEQHDSLAWHRVLQPLVEATHAWHEQGLRLDDIILHSLHATGEKIGPIMLYDHFSLRNPVVFDTFSDHHMDDLVSSLLTGPKPRRWSGRYTGNTTGKEAKRGLAATDNTETSLSEVDSTQTENPLPA